MCVCPWPPLSVTNAHLHPVADPHGPAVARAEVRARRGSDEGDEPRRQSAVSLFHPHPDIRSSRRGDEGLDWRDETKREADENQTASPGFDMCMLTLMFLDPVSDMTEDKTLPQAANHPTLLDRPIVERHVSAAC